MEIIYCEKCGVRIPQGDFERGVAIQTDEGAYCAKCAPEAPAAARIKRRTPGGASRRSGSRIETGKFRRGSTTADTGKFRRATTTVDAARSRRPAPQVDSGAHERDGSRGRRREAATHPRAGASGRGGSNVALIAVGALACGFAIAGAAIFALGSGGESRRRPPRNAEPDAEQQQAPATEPPAPAPPAPEPESPTLGLQALGPVTTRPEPPPLKRSKTAPRIDKSYPLFIDSEDTYLDRFKLACKRGEAWLLKPEGEPPKPVVYATRAAAPPKLDGSLDDECWKTAGGIAEFVIGERNTAEINPPAPEKSEAWFCYDDDNLYLAVKATDGDIAGLRREGTLTKRGLWKDDGIELFFDFNRNYSTYRQIMINVDGARSEGSGHGGFPDTPGLTAKTVLYDKHWVMEVVIPLAGVGARGTKRGIVWGMNLVKNGYVAGEYYSSSWAHLKNQDNHAPLEFGYLIFK